MMLRTTVLLIFACGVWVCAQSKQAVPPGPGLMTPADVLALPVNEPDHKFAYGRDPNQYGELRVPLGPGPHPVVILIHGGCFMSFAGSTFMGPIADALKKDGIATWNIEFRRLAQPGGGWPGTYLDVGRAVDYLRTVPETHRLDLSRVVVVGHSAGAHLAMWTGLRHKLPESSPLFVKNPLAVAGVINLAGRMDMTKDIEHYHAKCSDNPVVTDLLGGTPAERPDRYRQVSANRFLPLGVSQVLIWGEHEDDVLVQLAQQYLRAAKKAGDDVDLILVPKAGHFETASPASAAWPVVRKAIRSLLERKD